jgi:hypothetical protein
MKNLKQHQIKKSAILTSEEFEYAVSEAMGVETYVHFDMDGIWYECYDKTIDNIDDVVKQKLSEYFEINITSIHIDDCDLAGVWLTFDKDLSPEKSDHFAEAMEELRDFIPKHLKKEETFKFNDLLSILEESYQSQVKDRQLSNKRKENELYLKGYFYFPTNVVSIDDAITELESLGLNMDNADEVELRNKFGEPLETLRDSEKDR